MSLVRYVDQTCTECVSGDSDSVSERPGRDEPAELQTDDEHLVWSPADRQHIRSLWQVAHPSLSESGIYKHLLYIKLISNQQMAESNQLTCVSGAVSLRSGRKWCFRARWASITPERRWYGRSMSSCVNLELWTEGRASSRRITTGWTGSCGSLPFRLNRERRRSVFTRKRYRKVTSV